MRERALTIAWSLVTNLLVLVGVVAWGWPPGNVFLLFWIENAILGIVTAVRVQTATGVPSEPTSGRTRPRWVQTGFFTVHYGIFLLVHAVFVGVIAFMLGTSLSFWALGMPAILIALRYTVDLVSVWFAGGQRSRTTPDEAFAMPYPRLFVLHVATILGFMVVVVGFVGDRTGQVPWAGVFTTIRDWLAAGGLELSNPAIVVGMLMILKSIADIWVARAGRIKLANLRFTSS